MRGVGIQNAGTDLFKAGDKLNVFARARGQLDVCNAVSFQTDVNHQLVRVVLHLLGEHARFEFRFAHAHVADHRFHQREAPQRLRNVQRLALGAVHKQLQVFPGRDAVGPVRVSDGGTANGNQVVTVVQRFIGIGGIHHAAHAHHRYLSQRFRTHRAVFFDQRRRVLGVNNGRTQGRADGEVQVIQAACRQFFQQVHGVFKADARHFQLFRREAIANNKGVVRVLAHHFVGDIQNRQRELRAVIAAAAPLVVTLVRVWRIELLNQIGVRTVNFHAVEAGLDGAAHRFTKLADHAFDFFASQCHWRCCALTRRGNSAWANRRTATDQFRVDHAAAVVDLQQGFRSFGFDRLRDFRQPGNFLVIINPDRAREGETEIVDEAALHNDGADASGTGTIVLHQFAGDGAVVIAGAGGHRGH
ncbi:hypothetical protein EKINANG_31350 [Enterobacter sp. KINAN-G]|nr:hypothetical protein EKINANG_31350 [Enterobacter sp. KINAN-G]